MREISGDLHIVDYKTKMVIASLKPEDYIEDLRHWELKDNADILDIKLLDESPFLIYFQQKNLILKETLPGVITPYVITEIAKDSAAHTATVYASGEWIKLDKDAYITPQKITSKDAAYYMNFATARTIWEVGVIEAVGTRTMTIDTFISPLRFIKEVATLFDNVEIQYRIVMNPTKPPTRYIDLVKKRGRETDKEITLGKDLLGIKRMENSENIITALVPFVMGRDADGNDKLITIESVNNGLQYIVDDAAYQRWNVDGKHLFGFYTPETDNEDMAPARLLTLAKTELKKRVDTIVSYEVDSVDISRVFGYEHEAVGEGDTIRIIDEGMTPTLYLEARAVAGDESRKDKRKNKYTFGNFVEIINPDEALRKLYQKMLTMIGDKVPKGWFGALETKLEETKKKADTAAEESQTAKDLANATKDYMEQNLVDIIESVKPPTANLNPNKTLWLDSSDPANKILKMYKGNGVWERIVPDTSATDKELQALIKEVQSLDGEVTAAQKQVGEQAVEINAKVDRTWLDQEMLKKANADNVYTKEYVDKNLVGKQVYETDKQANIKSFTDINTKYEQTAEALKLTATKEELKQTNTNVTNVTKTANEVKISADENSKKIEKVEGDFKNIKIGSVNLAIESEFICDVKNATANYSSIKTLKTSSKINFRNKKVTLSYILTGNITGKGTNPWTGAEIVVRYADDEAQYLSIRRDASAIGTTWSDALQSQTFTIKDKDVKSLMITTGSRDVFGNINISHVQLEEGTIPTAWNPAIEEAVSTGEFTQTTNEITQKVDSNTAKITKVESSFTNNNYLVQSSANNEYPEFAGDVGGHQASRSTMTFENDYIKLVSTDGLDSFYQIGNYKLNDMRGLSPNQDYTLSVDAKGDAGFCHLVLFEHNGTGWYEAKQIPTKISPDTFTRISATFKLSINAKAFILRIRYPMSANSTGKLMTFKNVKLEDGLIPTRWTPAGIDEKTFVKTTNEIKQGVEENSQTITKVEKKTYDGSNNILRNAGFDDGYTFWNPTTNVSVDTSVKLRGYNSVKVNQIGATSDIYKGGNQTVEIFETGKKYTGTVWVMTDDKTTIDNDGGFEVIGLRKDGTRAFTSSVPLNITKLTNGQWFKLEVTTVVVPADVVKLQFSMWVRRNGRLWLSNPQLELGEMSSDFKLSSKDYSQDSQFSKKTNEIVQTVDSNTATIKQITTSIAGGHENLIFQSSCNKVKPQFFDNKNNIDNGITSDFFDDYMKITCGATFTDSFYQVGSTGTNYMHGVTAGETLTMKWETYTDTPSGTYDVIIMQYANGGWSESLAYKVNSLNKWTTPTFTFKLGAQTTGWMIRFRFPRTADSVGKVIRLRKIKLEVGEIATPWSLANEEQASTYDVTAKTNEIKQTVDKNSQTITAISKTQGDHGKLIGENKTAIEQTQRDIQIKVSETQMQDYIGTLGAENILFNTAYETKVIDKNGNVTSRTPSLDKWTIHGSGTGINIKPNTSVLHDGYNSVIINCYQLTGPLFAGISQNATSSQNAGDFVLSGWFYTDKIEEIDKTAQIELKFWNGSTAVGQKNVSMKPLLKSGVWTFVKATMPAPNVAHTHVNARIFVEQNGTIWCSQLQLQKGKEPSTYMPSPKDITNYGEMIDLIGSKVATSEFNQKVTTMQTTLDQNTREINLKAVKEDVYTKIEGDNKYGDKAMVERHEASITTQAEQINLRVQKGDVASTINQTAQSVLIQASKINLDGAVTAKSIQSQRLVGATISTLEQNQIGGFVEMNAQNFSLRHRTALNIAPITRGYLGFMPNVGKNGDYIRTSLVLGNNYDNANNTALEGSIFIEHTTPELNRWSDASARIGIAKSRNADTTINVKSEINFRSTGTMDVMAREGAMNIYGRDDMTVSAGNRMMVSSSAGYFELTNGRGMFPITNQTLKIVDKRVSNNNDNADTDVILGNSFMIRSANDSAYFDYGLQIKKINGNEWANLWAGKVRASTFENTSSRAIKSYIKDIEVDALDTVMALEPKEYYFKTDIEELYRQRQERVDSGENTEPITLESLDKQYGFIAEDVPDAIATRDRKSVPSYKLATITVGAVQQIRREQLADQEKIASLKAEIEAEKLEKVSIQTELNELKGVLISQEDRIAKLEELLLQQLINKK